MRPTDKFGSRHLSTLGCLHIKPLVRKFLLSLAQLRRRIQCWFFIPAEKVVQTLPKYIKSELAETMGRRVAEAPKSCWDPQWRRCQHLKPKPCPRSENISPLPCWRIKKGPVLPEDAILQELFYGIKIIPGKKRRKPPKKQDNMKWPKATHALQEPLASCTWNA